MVNIWMGNYQRLGLLPRGWLWQTISAHLMSRKPHERLLQVSFNLMALDDGDDGGGGDWV